MAVCSSPSNGTRAQESTLVPNSHSLDEQPTVGTANPRSSRMQCMEIWGGNRPANEYREMTGINAWVFSKPYGGAQGGGDLYYLSTCASGRITRLLLADVSGHGEVASDLALSLRQLMRRNVNMVNQRNFVRSMNEQFGVVAKNQCFATAVVMSHFSPTSTLSISNAGHPRPLVFRQSLGEWSPVDVSGREAESVSDLPLGITDSVDYSNVQLELNPGDLVLTYSDALPESLDSNGQLLGEAGVVAAANGIDSSDPRTIISQLWQAIERQHEHNLQGDDATVILCQATSTSPSVRDNLLAPIRLLSPTRDDVRIDDSAWT